MAEIKAPTPLKSHEREFGEIMEKMVGLMSQIYRNQVLKELNQSTIDKFEDAQIGNYAAIFLKLSKRAKKKLIKRFNDDRIEKLTKAYLNNVNKRNQEQLYKRLGNKIGIDPKQLSLNEHLKPTTNALILETAQWAKKLRDETLELYTANTLRAMALGTDIEEVMNQFEGMEEKRKNHAKFTARNQINNFNSIMTKTRAQNAGIRKATWITADDERVRPCHEVRDGKEFNLDEGLYSSCDGKTLLPGTDYNCRCTYELIIEDD